MRLRKRRLRQVVWAVVDRYDPVDSITVFTSYTKAEALRAARHDLRWSNDGRLSVVRLFVDAASEVEVAS